MIHIVCAQVRQYIEFSLCVLYCPCLLVAERRKNSSNQLRSSSKSITFNNIVCVILCVKFSNSWFISVGHQSRNLTRTPKTSLELSVVKIHEVFDVNYSGSKYG